MKAIFILLLLLAASACDSQKRPAAPEDYREEAAVEAAHSELTLAVEGVRRLDFTAHCEWIRVETIKRDLKLEQKSKELEVLTKELEEATTASKEAGEAYERQLEKIKAALKSGRPLLHASAKPKSLKLLETEVHSAEQLLSALEDWRRRADDAAIQLLNATDPDDNDEAQRKYYKIAQEYRDLK